MPTITSDRDLPKLLDSPAKQVKWTKKLAIEHLGSAAKRFEQPPMQGMFSKTMFVTLADARQVVVQFRTEPLDVDAFRIAKSALGSFVPDARALKSQELEKVGAWAYSFPRMPGKMWHQGIAGRGAAGRVAVNKSLGRVFSKGCLAEDSNEAVEKTIRPHLDAILASPLEEILPFKGVLQGFANKLDELAQLPLWVAHYDLNDVNVLIDEHCEVTALIDWELSSPLPFGAGFGRIHTLAGEFTEGEFWMPDEFEDAERGFWKELFDGMPRDIGEMLEKRIGLVQRAVTLGTLLDCFFLDNGKVGCSQVTLKALPKFLTYQIPLIRGQKQPYCH
ncbi:hypothetical protein J7T55_001961 [Diaporthe amygdali]|uniref:uncharacterized protein n=1 Tax=Phomopsis amygdali TaxID=1214568 RepID=UPI0022FE1734|nr:uncharacterized protein J7T55_001961 [Diaporthe amygdali]KAJ0117761.1 hypothetical protein J7T55_001961 [Diaporthe amygdali]